MLWLSIQRKQVLRWSRENSLVQQGSGCPRKLVEDEITALHVEVRDMEDEIKVVPPKWVRQAIGVGNGRGPNISLVMAHPIDFLNRRRRNVRSPAVPDQYDEGLDQTPRGR